MRSQLNEYLNVFELENFFIQTLKIDSKALKKNPLGDSSIRHNPVLLPKSTAPKKGWPVIFYLSGFTGNGTKVFSDKVLEENVPQIINCKVSEKKAPQAIYVFVDAKTFWGGSQFRNSTASGKYEDYIMHELVPEVKTLLPTSILSSHWCITGASSGGYGALHLGSLYPEIFGIVAAQAPDSDFERSLFPEIYSTAGTLNDIKFSGVKNEFSQGRLFRRKNGFDLLNVTAMSYCYVDKKKPTEKDLPVDIKTGDLHSKNWQMWKEKDPIYFLPKRIKNLKKLKKIYLDVGIFDQFHLAFGARKMAKYLKSQRLPLDYNEFRGNHFDMAPRRLILWEKLEKRWKTLG